MFESGSIVFVRNTKSSPWWPSCVINAEELDPVCTSGIQSHLAKHRSQLEAKKRVLIVYYGTNPGSMFDFPKTVSAEIQDFAENAEKYRNQKCPAKSKPSIDLGWAEAEVDLKLPIKDRLKRFRIQENVMQVESEGTAQSLEREMKSIEEKGKGKPSNKTIQTKQDSESQTQNSRKSKKRPEPEDIHNEVSDDDLRDSDVDFSEESESEPEVRQTTKVPKKRTKLESKAATNKTQAKSSERKIPSKQTTLLTDTKPPTKQPTLLTKPPAPKKITVAIPTEDAPAMVPIEEAATLIPWTLDTCIEKLQKLQHGTVVGSTQREAFKALSLLSSMELSGEQLMATGLGKLVKRLSKHANPQIALKAATQLQSWTQSVTEQMAKKAAVAAAVGATADNAADMQHSDDVSAMVLSSATAREGSAATTGDDNHRLNLGSVSGVAAVGVDVDVAESTKKTDDHYGEPTSSSSSSSSSTRSIVVQSRPVEQPYEVSPEVKSSVLRSRALRLLMSHWPGAMAGRLEATLFSSLCSRRSSSSASLSEALGAGGASLGGDISDAYLAAITHFAFSFTDPSYFVLKKTLERLVTPSSDSVSVAVAGSSSGGDGDVDDSKLQMLCWEKLQSIGVKPRHY